MAKYSAVYPLHLVPNITADDGVAGRELSSSESFKTIYLRGGKKSALILSRSCMLLPHAGPNGCQADIACTSFNLNGRSIAGQQVFERDVCMAMPQASPV